MMKRTLTIAMLISLSAGAVYAQVLDIADIKKIDDNLRPIFLGQVVTVAGTVTVGSGTFAPEFGDLDAYIQDGTGGINIYTRSLGGLTLAPGDSVMVTGRINLSGSSPTSGTTRLRIESASNLVVVGPAAVPDPLPFSGSELNEPTVPPDEPYEGVLVRIDSVTIESGTWPAQPGVNAELVLSDPSGTFTMYINGNADIGGTDQPGEPFILAGIVVQDSRTLSGNYTVWPRSREDFLETGNGSGIAGVDPAKVENDLESFDLKVTLAGNGLDTITSFSIDLPLADGWQWSGGSGNIELSGPGLSGAAFEATASGAMVSGAAILDAGDSFGKVTFKGMSPPPGIVISEVAIETSVDGITKEEIAQNPLIESVYPKPDIIISELWPDDGSTASNNSFIELYNNGDFPAFLEGYALCEQAVESYCDIAVRHVFGADTLQAGEFMVIAKSAAGIDQRFGVAPDVAVNIKPLGRVSGDGAICGFGENYEAISLWRDSGLRDLVAYVEYTDALACTIDLCEGFGDIDDAFPYIPPVGYSLIAGEYNPCCPYEVLTGEPTPGAANAVRYLAPTVDGITSFETNTLEVTFSEPMAGDDLENKSNYSIDGDNPLNAVASLSGEKVLLLFEDLETGEASIHISGLHSLPGIEISDSSYTFTVSSTSCAAMCEVQAYDSDGFSPLRGTTVCALGFITVPPGVFQPDYSSLYVQSLDGCGVNVFSYDVPSPAPKIGDFVYVSGEVVEYVSTSGAGATTEISMASPGNLSILSTGYPEPDPLVLTTAGVSREDHEGKLVQSEGAVISVSDIDFYIDDGSGGIQVYQNFTDVDFTRYVEGMYVRVTGAVLQFDFTRPFLAGYELVPRYDSDIEIIEDAFPQDALLEVETRVFCPTCGEDAFDIIFGGPGSTEVILRIFDGAGRKIRTLYSGRSVGEVTVPWDGRDNDGKLVPAGLYICHIELIEAVSGRISTETAPIVVGVQLK
jgi:hypothetical protein